MYIFVSTGSVWKYIWIVSLRNYRIKDQEVSENRPQSDLSVLHPIDIGNIYKCALSILMPLGTWSTDVEEDKSQPTVANSTETHRRQFIPMAQVPRMVKIFLCCCIAFFARAASSPASAYCHSWHIISSCLWQKSVHTPPSTPLLHSDFTYLYSA